MPDLTVYIGPVGGPLLGAFIALVGVVVNSWLSHRHQLEQDVLRDERALRDAKLTRLRETFEIVLQSADAMKRAALRMNILLGDETRATRDAELNQLLTKATEGLERARIRLLIEPEGQPVYAVFEEIRDAWYSHESLVAERETGNNSIRATEVGAERRRLEQGYTQLLQAVCAVLERLDKPIRDITT